MATSSFAKNFVLNPKEMTKECKAHLFDKKFNSNNMKNNFRSHIASDKDVKEIISIITK